MVADEFYNIFQNVNTNNIENDEGVVYRKGDTENRFSRKISNLAIVRFGFPAPLILFIVNSNLTLTLYYYS